MMEKESRIVGKQALETLTTGMYADSRVIFREYIQNSADAIDKAVSNGILENRDEGRIDVTIDPEQREIRIRDNGIGISLQEVYHELGDIGKSQKLHTENRGFRGIGRLGGLAYCKELQFITSFRGEDRKTITIWDCAELRRYLQPDVGREMSIIDVVDAVTVQADEPEEIDAHYFEVVLIGIEKEHDNLLEIDDVQNYLSQVAPVSFNPQCYIELIRINQKLRELGKEPEEFNIYLNGEQIYKLYRNYVDIGEKKRDFIKSIEFFESRKGDDSLYFLGWYGMTDFSGMVKDNSINGLRIRKGNILIGDNRTADEFFGKNTNQRFNRWYVGEIYVFDSDLIPNARRDDFEKNSAYFKFKQEVEKITLGNRTTNEPAVKTEGNNSEEARTATEEESIREPISTSPRPTRNSGENTGRPPRTPHPRGGLIRKSYDHSKSRSNRKKMSESTQRIREIQKIVDDPTTITEISKEALLKELEDIRKRLEAIKFSKQFTTGVDTDTITSPEIDKDIEEKENLLRQIDDLVSQLQAIKKNVGRIPSSYPKEVRSAVDRVFEVIDKKLDEGLATELKAAIIEEFQIKPKDRKK